MKSELDRHYPSPSLLATYAHTDPIPSKTFPRAKAQAAGIFSADHHPRHASLSRAARNNGRETCVAEGAMRKPTACRVAAGVRCTRLGRCLNGRTRWALRPSLLIALFLLYFLLLFLFTGVFVCVYAFVKLKSRLEIRPFGADEPLPHTHTSPAFSVSNKLVHARIN